MAPPAKLHGVVAETGDATRALMSSVSRIAVLDALRQTTHALSVAELANAVGLHANTVRWHLDQLASAGWIACHAEAREGPGRPRYLYALAGAGAPGSGEPGSGVRDAGFATPAAPAESPPQFEHGYRLLARILAGCLGHGQPDAATAAETAGRAWGGYLVQTPAPFSRIDAAEAQRRVVGMLDELGFRPAVEPSGWFTLRACPFRDVAKEHPEVACSVHLGLIRGALAQLGQPVGAVRLAPFSSPDACRAHLDGRDLPHPAETADGHRPDTADEGAS